MFIPKWILAILFIVAVGSTIGLLYTLTIKTHADSEVCPTASATVVVANTATPSATPSTATGSASPLSATAEWKKYSFKDLSISFEYPARWYVESTDSGDLRIQSFEGTTFPSGDASQQIQITVSREKKSSSTAKLQTYLDQRLADLKKQYTNVAMPVENSRKIDDYDTNDRTYTLGDNQTKMRELVFATRSYFYTLTVSPTDSSLNAIADEVFKSMHIL